ncbi:hypothetical protein [Yoonia maritima]|uniref:hypothetical protein n=1 Tax=Yoonia maritima TaxID=1435347 RepID=UPI0013A68693|nr:hypothetical protein [Yoonia maritima]
MHKIIDTLQVIGGALIALILAPVVALFGLTILGLAIGAAALMTGTITAMVWQQNRAAKSAKTDADAPTEAEAQPA